MYKDFFLEGFNFLLMVILLLLSVGFFTMLERKVLGYVQIRKGPNKLGFIGIFQPFSDGMKLLLKEQVYPLMSNFNLFYMSPMFNLFISLLFWMCIPYVSVVLNFNLGVLFFLCCSSIAVYSIMLAAWSSNSSYALLGGVRLIAQVISYEVSFFLILLSFLYLILSFNFFDFGKYQDVWFLALCLFLCMAWLVSSLAETNRMPFDFSEGESELVSGFNVEYSGIGFMLIFLSEYLNILFMSMLCSLIFLGGNISDFFFFLKLSFMIFLWVWVRGTLPRYRYDKLMYLCWKSYLPISLNYLFFYISLKLLIFSFLI